MGEVKGERLFSSDVGTLGLDQAGQHRRDFDTFLNPCPLRLPVDIAYCHPDINLCP
jgi:hypothetical protein